MTITDGFGTWSDLGTVTPLEQQWVKFPGTAFDVLTGRQLSLKSSSFEIFKVVPRSNDSDWQVELHELWG